MLSTRFSSRRNELVSREPLTDEQIRRVAPSIFADDAHNSRSERYSYIPTADVLAGLRKEGFEPFHVVQSRTRLEDRRDHTKHMLRLRHRSMNTANQGEANEIIMLNSHDGTSSYQMLAGCWRFVCANGLLVGDTMADIRIPHKGDVRGRVIEGAFTVLDHFERVTDSIDTMKALTLSEGEQRAFAAAALELRYDEGKAPIEAHRLLEPQRRADTSADLWSVFNRVQENTVRGGQQTWNRRRQRQETTRAISGIDQSTKLNRALWVLADEMRKLRAH